MKIALPLVLILLAAAAPAAAQKPLRDQLNDTVPGARWVYDDWERARKKATKENKPIFAVFRCVP